MPVWLAHSGRIDLSDQQREWKANIRSQKLLSPIKVMITVAVVAWISTHYFRLCSGVRLHLFLFWLLCEFWSGKFVSSRLFCVISFVACERDLAMIARAHQKTTELIKLSRILVCQTCDSNICSIPRSLRCSASPTKNQLQNETHILRKK